MCPPLATLRVQTTWIKVNRDFGSIFSTLLPGTSAKLQPPDGGSVMNGLEVKVAFGSVWKETLTELSGGQRSLLALSLILSLLLFKPGKCPCQQTKCTSLFHCFLGTLELIGCFSMFFDLCLGRRLRGVMLCVYPM